MTFLQEAFSGGLYSEVWDHKPPLSMQIDYISTLGGKFVLLDHYVLALLIAWGAYGLFKILKRYIDSRSALFGALTFCLMIGVVNFGSNALERMMLPFYIWAIEFALRAIYSSKNKCLFFAFLSGFVCGAAALIKQTGGLMGIFPYLLLLFLFQKNRALATAAILIAILGGAGSTLLSWLASGVPIQKIWQEAYLSNLSYMGFTASKTRWDILNNFALVGLLYSSLIVGAAFGLKWAYNKLSGLWGRLSFSSKFLLGLCLIYLLGSTWLSISLGSRYYRSYFVHALPLLCTLSAFGVAQKPKLFKPLILWSLIILSGHHIYVSWMQYSDRNKNWDSHIMRVVEEIKKDTKPGDYIWTQQSLYTLYPKTNRKPATAKLYFHSVLGQIDICTASDDLLTEAKAPPAYFEQIDRLKSKAPKVIFWTDRPKNSCSNRLQESNYPSIQEFIDEHYYLKWESELGRYYLRKDRQT